MGKTSKRRSFLDRYRRYRHDIKKLILESNAFYNLDFTIVQHSTAYCLLRFEFNVVIN